jgi:hypothetical protein
MPPLLLLSLLLLLSFASTPTTLAAARTAENVPVRASSLSRERLQGRAL